MRSANWVSETTTSIAGTSGDGAVTLTAVTTTPRFSTVFGTQATTVRYVIRKTTNGYREAGIGSVASNVLTRTRPQVTWDGTTLDDSTPSALQFGATPTSGDVLIEIAPLAESILTAMPGVNDSITGEADWTFYRPSAANAIGGATGRTLTVNREYYQAYWLPNAGLFQGIQFQVATAQASSNLKMALYACGSNGLPGQKIVDCVTTATTTTGIKTDSATGSWSPAGPVWLAAGWYFIGYITGHAIAINGTSGTVLITQSPLGRGNSYGMTDTCYASGNYATGLPALPTPTTLAPINGGDARHWFGLRVVS